METFRNLRNGKTLSNRDKTLSNAQKHEKNKTENKMNKEITSTIKDSKIFPLLNSRIQRSLFLFFFQ